MNSFLGMQRDSKGLWWIMAGAAASVFTTRMDLLDRLIPTAWHDPVHAVIELTGLIVLALAGVARMSPLGISEEGRIEAARKDADTPAAKSALVAAKKADKAVVATADAKTAATVAHADAKEKEKDA